jgi:hypothetical protein
MYKIAIYFGAIHIFGVWCLVSCGWRVCVGVWVGGWVGWWVGGCGWVCGCMAPALETLAEDAAVQARCTLSACAIVYLVAFFFFLQGFVCMLFCTC